MKRNRDAGFILPGVLLAAFAAFILAGCLATITIFMIQRAEAEVEMTNRLAILQEEAERLKYTYAEVALPEADSRTLERNGRVYQVIIDRREVADDAAVWDYTIRVVGAHDDSEIRLWLPRKAG